MAYSFNDWFDTTKPQKFFIFGQGSGGEAIDILDYLSSDDGDFTSSGVSVDFEFSKDGNVSPGYCGSKNMSLTLYNPNNIIDGSARPFSLYQLKAYAMVYNEASNWRSSTPTNGENCWMIAGSTELVGKNDGLYVGGVLSWDESPVRCFLRYGGNGDYTIYMYTDDGVYALNEDFEPSRLGSQPSSLMPYKWVKKPISMWAYETPSGSIAFRFFDEETYEEYSSVLVGQFNVDSYEKDIQREVIDVDFFDVMTNFDKSARDIPTEMSATFDGYDLFEALCSEASVSPTENTDVTDELHNISLSKKYVFATNGLTLRDYYMYLAERLGAIGYINPLGQADFMLLSAIPSEHTIPANSIGAGSRVIEDEYVESPTMVVCYTTAGTTETYGSGSNVYESNNNALIYTDADGLAFCQMLVGEFASVDGYYPQTMDLIESSPYFYPFERITIGTETESFPITSFNYKWSVRGSASITSSGDAEREPISTSSVDSQSALASATMLNAARQSNAPTNFLTDYGLADGGYHELGEFVIICCEIQSENGMGATTRNVCKFPSPAVASPVNVQIINTEFATPCYAYITTSGFLRLKTTTAISGSNMLSVSGIYKKA